jgi:hypothetical protein
VGREHRVRARRDVSGVHHRHLHILYTHWHIHAYAFSLISYVHTLILTHIYSHSLAHTLKPIYTLTHSLTYDKYKKGEGVREAEDTQKTRQGQRKRGLNIYSIYFSFIAIVRVHPFTSNNKRFRRFKIRSSNQP